MTVLPPWSVADTIADPSSPERQANAHANGILVYCLYVSPTTSIGKVRFKWQIDALLAGGFGVVANYERGAGDWRLGPDVARQAGAWARNYVSGTGTTKVNGVVVPCWGWPTWVPIVYSIDTGVATSELPLAAAVMRAFSEPSGFPQDIYGPSNVGVYCVTVGAAGHFWQWKDGRKPNTVHTNIRQNYDTPYELGPPPYSYDINTPVTENFGQFYGGLVPPHPRPPDPPFPPTPPQEDEVSLLFNANDGTPGQQFITFAWNGVGIQWVRSKEQLDTGVASGLYQLHPETHKPLTNFSVAQLQQLIDQGWLGGEIPPGFTAPPSPPPMPPPPAVVDNAAIAVATRDEFTRRPLS